MRRIPDITFAALKLKQIRTDTARQVWRASTTSQINFHPLTKKQASQIWHRSRRWDKATRQKHKHGGIIGRSALSVLYALIWDFHNWRTGRIDPSQATIAKAASVSPRTVATAITKLRSLGILTWVRRCRAETDENNRLRLRQETNAYGIQNHRTWIGYTPDDPPPPHRSTLGYPTPVPTPLERVTQTSAPEDRKHAYTDLMADPTDRLAVALAQFGRAAKLI